MARDACPLHHPLKKSGLCSEIKVVMLHSWAHSSRPRAAASGLQVRGQQLDRNLMPFGAPADRDKTNKQQTTNNNQQTPNNKQQTPNTKQHAPNTKQTKSGMYFNCFQEWSVRVREVWFWIPATAIAITQHQQQQQHK